MASNPMTALVLARGAVRRDGDLWCMTDLWRMAGSPRSRRPVDWLRKEGAAFVDFVRDSFEVPDGHLKKTRGKGRGGGDTWAHWQIALAYAKGLSHELHAEVNAVYRAFKSGQLVPLAPSREQEELVRLTLRYEALAAGVETVWDLELKLERARLRKIPWDGHGREPRPLSYAYGRTWRFILGDAVYVELQRRNPHPCDGSLHAHWLQEQRYRLAKHEDLLIARVLARRCTRWSEYEAEMRAHFQRAPLQLRLVAKGA